MNLKNTVLCCALLAFTSISLAGEKEIAITQSAPYLQEDIVPSKIRNECTNLGEKFSNFTKTYLEKRHWKVTLDSNIEANIVANKKGKTLKLWILNAFSAGNAFTGHKKSVTIKAELYNDGELVDSYTGTRNSGGGFGAGFKGSCSVLGRCVKALGNDVSKWLEKHSF